MKGKRSIKRLIAFALTLIMLLSNGLGNIGMVDVKAETTTASSEGVTAGVFVCDKVHHQYENGFCMDASCDAYEPAKLVEGAEGSYYEISNAGQLYWFAGLVNGDEKVCKDGVTQNYGANAVLTKDIVVNKNVLDANGDLSNNFSTFREWIPIGFKSKGYHGDFNGNVHTISGLYYDDSTRSANSYNYFGLFGLNKGAYSIRKIGVIDTYFKAGNSEYCGLICGYALNECILTECYSNGVITGKNVGGICGYVSGRCRVLNCYSSGKIEGTGQVGGITGILGINTAIGLDKISDNISKCYSMADINNNDISEGDSPVEKGIGAICALLVGGKISDCYYSKIPAIGYLLDDRESAVSNLIDISEEYACSDITDMDKFDLVNMAYQLGKSGETYTGTWGIRVDADGGAIDSYPHLAEYDEEGNQTNYLYEYVTIMKCDGVTSTGESRGWSNYNREPHVFNEGNDKCNNCDYVRPTKVSSLDDAKTAIEDAVLNRKTDFKLELVDEALSDITIQESTQDELAKIASDYLEELFVHSETSNKLGDYLKYSIGKQQVGISYSEVTDSNGTRKEDVTFTYCIPYYTDKIQEAFVDDKLTEVFYADTTNGVGITATMSEAQKVQAIYHWITNNVAYDNDNLTNDANKTKYTAYGALHDGKAVCQGFANLFYRMCMDNGIDCRIVTGTGTVTTDTSTKEEPHAWNLVKVDGNYYLADATWDCMNSVNGNSTGKYDYFLRSESGFTDHTEKVPDDATAKVTEAYKGQMATKDYVPFVIEKTGGYYFFQDLNGNASFTAIDKNDATNAIPLYELVKSAETGCYEITSRVDNNKKWTFTHNYDENGLCGTCGHQKTINLIIHKKDTDGNDVPGDTTLGGSNVQAGNSYTIEAPLLTGYNFVGWYKTDADGKIVDGATPVCKTRSFIIDTSDTSISEHCFLAQYKALGKTSVTISGSKSYKINNTTYSNNQIKDFSLGQRVTLEALGENFAYWSNGNNMILSRKPVYEFTVTGTETINAVYNNINADSQNVILNFESYYGAIVQRWELADATDETLPALPIRLGYDTMGWDCDGDGTYNKASDTIQAAIVKAKDNGNVLTLKAIYEEKNETFTVTVVNGTFVNGTQASFSEGDSRVTAHISDKIFVTPNTPEAGKKFSHWILKDSTDTAGKIVSYNEKYAFFATKECTVEAVYVEDATKVEAKGTAELISNYVEEGKAYYIGFFTVPENCKINKAGFISTKDATIGANAEQFIVGNSSVYVNADATDYSNYRYTLRFGSDAWYTRLYLNYTDADGNTVEVYGDIIDVSIN